MKKVGGWRLKDNEKTMPKEVAQAISNIMKFLEKSENDYINSKKVNNRDDKEAEHENK